MAWGSNIESSSDEESNDVDDWENFCFSTHFNNRKKKEHKPSKYDGVCLFGHYHKDEKKGLKASSGDEIHLSNNHQRSNKDKVNSYQNKYVNGISHLDFT